MDRRTFLKAVPAVATLGAMPGFAQENASAPAASPLKPGAIALVKPQTEGGKSVMASLWERKTNRNITAQDLSPQMLSNLLWAAWGVNRQNARGGRSGRTAASASNSQEIDLYVFRPEGVYLYEAATHSLTPVAAGDQRAMVGRGRGGAMAKAPVNLIFVADLAKFANGQPQEPGLKDPEIQKAYYYVATGLIAQNVYLFAASQGLAAWFHNCNKTGVAQVLKLRPEQHALFGQTVGYPA